MPRFAMAPLLALLLAATFVQTASAESFYTKRGAEKLARDAVETRYGYSYFDVSASCRPQGQSYDPAFKYHKFVCGWAAHVDSDICDSGSVSGALFITGSRAKGAYYHRVWKGALCD